MTSAQLIVLGLLVAAFVSGWVARGAGHAAAADAPPSEIETEGATLVDVAPPGTAEAIDAASLVEDAVADLTAAIDAWMDRHDAVGALARVAATSERVREAAADTGDPVLAEVANALDDADEALAPMREGAPLTAASSRRLDEVEERLATAAGRVQRS